MSLKERIAKIDQRKAHLDNEQAELRALLEKKSAELKGLADGVNKYKDNQKLSENMNNILRQKVNELQEIKNQIEDHKKEIQSCKHEIAKVYSLANKLRKQKEAQKSAPVSISESPAVDKAIEKAISASAEAKVKAEKVEVPKPEKKEEHKVPAVPKKAAKPKKDLYSQAAEEAKAQEEFLKKQSGRSYGNA